MATYAIGDIHGCLTALKTIFELGNFQPSDTIVCLGDYIDRGPDSKGVLDFLIGKQQAHQLVFIKGNHDIMMEAARNSTEHYRQWAWFGGTETLDSYNIGDDPDWVFSVPEAHWQLLGKALPYYAQGNRLFVHAGFEPGKPLTRQSLNALHWHKYQIPEQYEPNKLVICGHTSRKNGEIADFGHTICIDTCCYGGQWLTCLNTDTGEWMQAHDAGISRTGKLENGGRFA